MMPCAPLFCLALVSPTVAAAPAPALDDPVVVDDTARRGVFVDGLVRAVGAGRAVPLAELRRQLEAAERSGGEAGAVHTLPPPGRSFTPAEIHRRACRSVVVVGRLYVCPRCKRRHTSVAAGFVIEATGRIVTDYHVVATGDGETLGVMTFDGRVLPVRAVAAADRDTDLAIVTVDAAGLEPLPVGSAAPVGAPVHVVSHPDSRFFSFTSGVVSRYFTRHRGAREDEHREGNPANEGESSVSRMAITADYARGSSGAPVLDAHGAVVGIVRATTSIYHHTENGVPHNLQMVVKECIPVAALRRLVKAAHRTRRF